MDNIQKNIGVNLKNLRKARGLSLDTTANLTNVSKAMLGQIERGESNPTVTTLWKIATGLQVSFSSLIQEQQSPIHVVNRHDISPIMEYSGKYRVYPVFPFDPRKKFEIFTVEIETGYEHLSEKHNEGVEEYVTVITGTLQLEINEQQYTIQPGNSIRFSANKAHTYRNIGEDMIIYQTVLYYP
ncbi:MULTISPECIES: helix-turn-helix domain-containing protein [Cytobacillus]|uniref:helix-turn-helix domain-containing protein n=1 Tax=Cytobacillus TaxID=2675230 RepID=UPI001CD228C4|nr:XRE family transcriptional regulator [Cytobacillus kochii]MCA1027406.1 XRE family transcriptional regulator [Cytobacillus kochii]MCM3322083.1 XRE family transcriptional regulator [Cytobacillus kochii]MCM3343085.1 XRE family transcriptional regulator [Cytobacillus kochii]MDM5206915.1 XRE family transcriptional regulator [Cytobacillus kochii]